MGYIEMRLRSFSSTDHRSHWLAMTPWDGEHQRWETDLIDLTISGNGDNIHIIMPLDRAREMVEQLQTYIPHAERSIRLRDERLAREKRAADNSKSTSGLPATRKEIE